MAALLAMRAWASTPATAVALRTMPTRRRRLPLRQTAARRFREVELTIDSLRNYELIRPIPVVVESLGERNFVAEMPDLNISTSANNQSDILIV